MKRECPTIQELLAFDAVARYKSATQAADALCITVSAVSKQLSGLEDFVGRPLLEKEGRSIRLTPQGLAYWQKISGALRAIETATFELRANVANSGLLTLASTPTFLTKWLIPRLPAFSHQHPGITLGFSQHLGINDNIPQGVDAAIRYGCGDWPGVVSEYLGGQEFVATWSPTLTQGDTLAAHPEDMSKQILLHHNESPKAWTLWAAHHGIANMHTFTGPHFAQYSAIIQAAVSGMGVALVPRLLITEELSQGALLIGCGEPITIGQGHYLCFRADRLDAPAFAIFRAWIRNEWKKGQDEFAELDTSARLR